jgi:hypothetical protein
MALYRSGKKDATRGTTLSAGGLQLRLNQVTRPDSLDTTASHTYGAVWGCSRALCDFFADMSVLNTALFQPLCHYVDFADLRVVELGAGTGCAGIFVAKFWPTCSVILTDVAPALSLISSNAVLNDCDNVSVRALNFGEDIISTLMPPSASSWWTIDAIVCSDLLFSHLSEPYYWDELAQSLAAILGAREGVCSGGVVVWFMFQERWGSRDISPFFLTLRTVFAQTIQAGSLGIPEEINDDDGATAHHKRGLVISEINHSALHVEDKGDINTKDADYYPMRLIRISTC